MNFVDFNLAGATLRALPSGALFWPAEHLLCVSDLHLGKAERHARRGGTLLPPYEVHDTMMRLQADIGTTAPQTVVCLGDSFDDSFAAEAVSEELAAWLARLQAGRNWIWITGNHDPAPIDVNGTQIARFNRSGLTFRHIADPAAKAEVSGHYHPKAGISARGRQISRPAFLYDHHRLILPAFGTYTGGLRSRSETLVKLMQNDACAILTGQPMARIPMPR